MNVNIFENNPDWRWYFLFVGASLTFTIIGWLTFKYSQVNRPPFRSPEVHELTPVSD